MVRVTALVIVYCGQVMVSMLVVVQFTNSGRIMVNAPIIVQSANIGG